MKRIVIKSLHKYHHILSGQIGFGISYLYVIGRVKAYPRMHHLVSHRDTQSIIAYINTSLTQYYWEFQSNCTGEY